jgi:predicted nicotinamide N-methyase
MYYQDAIDNFCEKRQVSDLPITIYTTKINRFRLSQLTTSNRWNLDMAMWSEAFSAGEIMARYILKHPEKFAGKKLIDVGTGSGLVAIAAAMCGAQVQAVDIHPWTEDIVAANAVLNKVKVGAMRANGTDQRIYEEADIITAADVFYIHKDIQRLIDVFAAQAENGKNIYVCSQDEDLTQWMCADPVYGNEGRNVVCILRNRQTFKRAAEPAFEATEQKSEKPIDYRTRSDPSKGERRQKARAQRIAAQSFHRR